MSFMAAKLFCESVGLFTHICFYVLVILAIEDFKDDPEIHISVSLFQDEMQNLNHLNFYDEKSKMFRRLKGDILIRAL